MKYLKYVTTALFLVMLVHMPTSNAQTKPPKLLISWRADSFAPADFPGKILPVANSRITAAFELVDRGKAANVSREVVYWYVNGNLIENKPGAQQVVFRVPAFPGRTIDLRVELPGYAGGILKTVEIPIVRPRVVVDAPLPNGILTTLSAKLRGLPYFFNVKSPLDLSFVWNVNGVAPHNAGDPTILAVNLPGGTPSGGAVQASLMIGNPKDALEAAAGFATLTYVP